MKHDLQLRKEIYEFAGIERAIADYSSICRIKCRVDGEYYDLSFGPCRYDKKLVISEFLNYLIDIHNTTEIL